MNCFRDAQYISVSAHSRHHHRNVPAPSPSASAPPLPLPARPPPPTCHHQLVLCLEVCQRNSGGVTAASRLSPTTAIPWNHHHTTHHNHDKRIEGDFPSPPLPLSYHGDTCNLRPIVWFASPAGLPGTVAGGGGRTEGHSTTLCRSHFIGLLTCRRIFPRQFVSFREINGHQ